MRQPPDYVLAFLLAAVVWGVFYLLAPFYLVVAAIGAVVFLLVAFGQARFLYWLQKAGEEAA